jgi:hypothetical protein
MVSALSVRGQVPDGPTDFRADASDFFDDGANHNIAIQLRWTDNATNELGYILEVSTNQGTSYFTSTTLPVNAAGYDNARIPWTSNYWWRVYAYNAAGHSTTSAVVKVTGNMPPAHLAGSTVATNQMTVTWDTVGGTINGYTVQQATNSDFSGGLTNYFVLGIDTSSLNITSSFLRNVVYYFRVASTNSGAGTGNSEFMNKPISYLSCAPNGPPIAPTFITAYTTATSTNGQAPTEVNIYFDDFGLNRTGWRVQHSTDSNTWSGSIAFSYQDQPRQQVLDEALLPGTKYFYHLVATNALGDSPIVEFHITIPNYAGAGVTNWYIDNTATGNSAGTNWADAWTSIGAINWTRLGPGHTVFISGGASSQLYTDYLELLGDGTSNAPIVFRVSTNSGHNGRVIIQGEIGGAARWVTVDGSKDPAYVLPRVEAITNNINLEVLGRGDLNECIVARITKGLRILWVEVHGAGNPLAGDGLSAVQLTGDIDGPYETELGYCWVHENWCSGVSEEATAGVYGMGPGGRPLCRVHHCVVEYNRDNQFTVTRSMDIDHCIIRETRYPDIAHPDGVQGGIQDVRIYNNVIGNVAGKSDHYIYPNLGDGFYTNFWIVNNVFYDTYPDGPGLAVQFSFSGSTTLSTLSNVVVAGNTFYASNGVAFAVLNSAQDNVLKKWVVANNIFYSGAGSQVGAAAFSTGLADYSEADVIFEANLLCGPACLFYYRTNTGPAGVNLFPTGEAFDAWSSKYKHNTSTTPTVFSLSAKKFNLLGMDTAARGHGTNLSYLAAQFPAITNDLNDVPRGTNWDIGAYQYNEAGLEAQLVFENDFYSATNKHAVDASGNGRDGLRYGKPSSRTNYPTLTVSYDGSQAGQFRAYPTDMLNVGGNTNQYHSGDYIAITNIAGIKSLTNMTWACWANWDYRDQDATLAGGGGANGEGNWMVDTINDGSSAHQEISVVTNGVRVTEDHLLVFPDQGVSNSWHHYAFTWTGTNHTLTGYYDGVPCSTNTALRTLFALTVDADNQGTYLGIGCWTFDGNPDMQQIVAGGADDVPDNGWVRGSLDDWRLYSRALSPAEIGNLAAGGSSVSDGSAGPQGGGGAQPGIVVRMGAATFGAGSTQ